MGGKCTRRWWNMYEDQEVEINTGRPKNICRWTHHFGDSVLSLPNPDKHSGGKANTGRLTGVPATVAFVLCGLRCPTWWRCGQRPLRKAASGQDPTKESLYCLDGTEGWRENQVKGALLWSDLLAPSAACWENYRKKRPNTFNLELTTAGEPPLWGINLPICNYVLYQLICTC